MALYRNVQVAFWTDVKISDDFTPEDRYFYLYLFTNPHTNLCGCYELSVRQASLETGYTAEKVDKLIKRFERIFQVIRYSKETREIIIIKWFKYNWTSSKDFRKALSKEINNIKCPEFREYLNSLCNGEETVLEPIADGGENSLTDADANAVNEEKKPRTVFTPPTIEEVKSYCKERNNSVDAQVFVDFYQSKGWVIGKEKMKDWKAAVRTWERNRNGNSSQAAPKDKKYNDDFFTDMMARREAKSNGNNPNAANI